MYCTRCGLRVEEGTRYCPACGQEIGVSVALPPAAVSAPVSAPPPYAGFWVRFVAYLIDGVILGIPFFLAVIVLVSMFGGLRCECFFRGRVVAVLLRVGKLGAAGDVRQSGNVSARDRSPRRASDIRA